MRCARQLAQAAVKSPRVDDLFIQPGAACGERSVSRQLGTAGSFANRPCSPLAQARRWWSSAARARPAARRCGADARHAPKRRRCSSRSRSSDAVRRAYPSQRVGGHRAQRLERRLVLPLTNRRRASSAPRIRFSSCRRGRLRATRLRPASAEGRLSATVTVDRQSPRECDVMRSPVLDAYWHSMPACRSIAAS